jgi:hypothetical protein
MGSYNYPHSGFIDRDNDKGSGDPGGLMACASGHVFVFSKREEIEPLIDQIHV